MILRMISLLLLALFAFNFPAVAEREVEVKDFAGEPVDYVIKVDSLQALVELTADPERKLLQAVETENCYLVAYRVGENGLSVLMMYKAGTTGFPLGGSSYEKGTFMEGKADFHSFVRYRFPNPTGSSTKVLSATLQRVPPGFQGYIEIVKSIRPNEDQDLPKEEIPLKIYWQ